MSDELRIAAALLEGAEAIKRGEHEAALEPLRTVVTHDGLEATPALRDVRARALSLLAQAELATGHLDSAASHVDESLRLARDLEDRAGLEVVRTLASEVHTARAAHQAALAHTKRLRDVAATPLERLRDRARTPYELMDLLVQRANADLETGERATALPLAEEALGLAVEHGALREEILARLSIARARPELAPQQLLLAWRRAEEASAFTLVGAVARAADAQGVQLPQLAGPQMGPDAQ